MSRRPLFRREPGAAGASLHTADAGRESELGLSLDPAAHANDALSATARTIEPGAIVIDGEVRPQKGPWQYKRVLEYLSRYGIRVCSGGYQVGRVPGSAHAHVYAQAEAHMRTRCGGGGRRDAPPQQPHLTGRGRGGGVAAGEQA